MFTTQWSNFERRYSVIVEEIIAVSGLREALQNPDAGTNALIVDMLLHPLDGPFWRERSAKDSHAKIPAFLGACWGNYGLHHGLEGVARPKEDGHRAADLS
jgi:hypothetical protein